MQYQYLHEVLRLLLKKSNQDPDIFISFFNESDNLIGFNYCCTKKKFTNFSRSFEKITGYNPENVLVKDDFISKIVHPHDRAIIIDYLFGSNGLSNSDLNISVVHETKCRAKHLKGYWKYLVLFYVNYLNPKTRCINKMGLMGNEYINSKYDSVTRDLDDINWENITNGESAFMYKTSSISISRREAEVLELIGDGNIGKEIANKLNISPTTVITHRKNLISKFNVRNTAQLIKKASQLFFI